MKKIIEGNFLIYIILVSAIGLILFSYFNSSSSSKSHSVKNHKIKKSKTEMNFNSTDKKNNSNNKVVTQKKLLKRKIASIPDHKKVFKTPVTTLPLLIDNKILKEKLHQFYPDAQFSFQKRSNKEIYRIYSDQLNVNVSDYSSRKRYAEVLSQSFIPLAQSLDIKQNLAPEKKADQLYRERYKQYCQGIPIENSYITLFYYNNTKELASTNINLKNFDCNQLAVSHKVTSKEAENIIGKVYEESKVSILYEESNKGKVIWADSSPAQLAWIFEVTVHSPIYDVKRIIVSAVDGHILYDQSVAIVN